MDSIFHEKQEGSLCAQHCLNALLQGPYFSPIDLAEIAQRLDESEREHMAEAGFMSPEYQQFITQPSSNYDDSGFFSIQVLQQSLSVWSLVLEPFNSSSPTCRQIRDNPRSAQAFVCNFREHWLTIRRIGNQWFNLNSLLTGPELLSDTYLSLFLTQLQHDGYSIFIVLGELPPCEAHDVLLVMPAVQPVKPSLIGAAAAKGRGQSAGGSESRSRLSSADDADLQRALAESRRLDEDQDETLKRALELSMLGFESTCAPAYNADTSAYNADSAAQETPLEEPDLEELRRRRLAFLDRADQPADSAVPSSTPSGGSTQPSPCGSAAPCPTPPGGSGQQASPAPHASASSQTGGLSRPDLHGAGSGQGVEQRDAEKD